MCRGGWTLVRYSLATSRQVVLATGCVGVILLVEVKMQGYPLIIQAIVCAAFLVCLFWGVSLRNSSGHKPRL